MENNNIPNRPKVSAVDNLILIFFRCSLSLNPDIVKRISWNDQKILLNSTLQNGLLKKYPINNEFAKSFLKKIIQILEEYSEVHDDFYTCLCSLMKTDQNANNEFCYRHYLINNDINNVITMKETNNIVVNGTTGMRTWKAGIILADWALCNMELFTNKTVLELGSGIGFTGITISKYCNIKALYLTDCHQDVLDTICTNIEINNPDRTKVNTENIISYLSEKNNSVIGVMKLDWNTLVAIPDFIIPDIVVGADIIYDPSVLRPLVKVFNILFKTNPKLNIFIASIIRNIETQLRFKEILEECNLSYEDLNIDMPTHLDWSCDIHKCLIRLNKRR